MFYAHSSSDIYYFLIEVKIVISMARVSKFVELSVVLSVMFFQH